MDGKEHLPTRSEIALESLDGLYAIKHFHGKTLAESEDLFAQAFADDIPLTYIEELLWKLDIARLPIFDRRERLLLHAQRLISGPA